jgi:hypothetical protein
MYEYFTLAGKCDMCRKRDRDAFLKERLEKRIKAEGKLLDEAGTRVESLKETIREVKAAKYCELFEGRGTPEAQAVSEDLIEKFRSPSPPIKVENESYSEGNTSEHTRVVKRQRHGEATMGNWIPVKWVAVDSREEADDKEDSAVGTGATKSRENGQNRSSEFSPAGSSQ